MNSTAKKLLTCTTVGVIIAGLVAWARGLFSSEDLKSALMILSDAFFVSGALLLAYGGLIVAKNGGATDGLGYSMKLLINRIRPSYEEHRQTFAEYREEREKKAHKPTTELIVGLVLFILALCFYGGYMLVG